MNKVVLGFAKELLSQREADILSMLFKDNMSLDDISEKINITRVRTTQLLNKATNRIIYRINQLEKMYNLSNDALSVRTENELLRKQNKELHMKFLRNKELGDIKSINVQHFLKHGYDIKDLKMSYIDFDLSVRTLNCLKLAYIETLEDLLACKKSDLMKFRNFGKKSLDELCDWLEDKYNWRLK